MVPVAELEIVVGGIIFLPSFHLPLSSFYNLFYHSPPIPPIFLVKRWCEDASLPHVIRN